MAVGHCVVAGSLAGVEPSGPQPLNKLPRQRGPSAY